METKLFTGNYSMSFGQPFVIISAKDNFTKFLVQSWKFMEMWFVYYKS